MGIRQIAARVRARTWVIGGAVVAVVVIGSIVVVGVVLPGSAEAQTQTRTQTAAASLETLEQTVSTTGTLTPTGNENVAFTVSGTVTAVDVTAGATVTAGQVLATVDTLQVDAALLQAKADLASAEARLADSESASSGSAADVAEVAAEAASVSVAQAAVDAATADVENASLTAPIDGVVTAVGVAVGDVISSGSSGNAAAGGAGGETGASTTATTTSGFTIVSTDSWTVDATVSESDLALISENDQVELSTDDGTEFFGTVTSIGMLPSTDSGAAAYPVGITVTGTADGLFDGISVSADIVYQRRTEVLTVPSAAVTTSDGASTVTTLDADGNEVTTTVEVGETVGNLTEITSGLAEGDEVVVATFTPGDGNAGDTGDFGGMPGEGFGGTPPDGTFPGGAGGTGGAGTAPDGAGQ